MRRYGKPSPKGAIFLLSWFCVLGPTGIGVADDPDASAMQARAAIASPELGLRLLGTAVAPRPALSWAAVAEHPRNEHRLVTVGSEIAPGVMVVGIERQRVILENDGRLEALLPDGTLRPADPGRRPAAEGTSSAAAPTRPGAAAEQAEVRLQRALSNPTTLYSQARIRPSYEAGEMVGLELSRLREGSTFLGLGLSEGDVVVAFDGQPLASPADGARFLRRVKLGSLSELRVLGTHGELRTLTLGTPE